MRRRQRRVVEVRLGVPDVATAVRYLDAHARGAWNKPGLRVRARDDGRVRARIATYSRYQSPPRLVGVLTQGPHGVVLEATIRESHAETFVPRLFTALALFMAAVCVGLMVAREFGNPGVYICGVSAVLFGLLGHVLARLRGVSFRVEADRLERAVREAMPG